MKIALYRRLHALAPGLTARCVLEKSAAVQIIDVHLPTSDGLELRLEVMDGAKTPRFGLCRVSFEEDLPLGYNEMLSLLAVAGYRSLREVRIRFGPLNIITGANGSGKSSLYRALRLLADIAQDRIIQSLAAEGGLPSAMWAGSEIISRATKRREVLMQGHVKQHPVSMKLGFGSRSYGYAIDLGLPIPEKPPSMFFHDPMIKIEAQWSGTKLSCSNAFATRNGPLMRVRSDTTMHRSDVTRRPIRWVSRQGRASMGMWASGL